MILLLSCQRTPPAISLPDAHLRRKVPLKWRAPLQATSPRRSRAALIACARVPQVRAFRHGSRHKVRRSSWGPSSYSPRNSYDDLKNLYAQANLPPEAKKVKPGEHLDIFPARLPRHCAPPLRISELRGLFPPLYILGWYYTMTEFGKRFGQDRPLDVFETRILDPYYEKLKDVADV